MNRTKTSFGFVALPNATSYLSRGQICSTFVSGAEGGQQSTPSKKNWQEKSAEKKITTQYKHLQIVGFENFETLHCENTIVLGLR